MLAALPPAFPTVCDLNTGNLEEGEGASAELTYFAGLGLSSFPSPQQADGFIGPNGAKSAWPGT